MALTIAEIQQQVDALVRAGDVRALRKIRDQVKSAADRKTAATRHAKYAADPELWVRERVKGFIWSKQAEIMRSVVENRRTAVHSAHGVGKALALDTPLPTPTGWTTMGETRPGDWLLDEQGKPCQIVAVSPIWTVDTYRVSFDDGSEITASGDHLWQVHSVANRPGGTFQGVADWRDHWAMTETRTTAELAQTIRTKGRKYQGQLRWRVPTAKPIQGEVLELPVAPYTLGAWLGDGHTANPAITVSHADAPHLLSQLDAEGVTVRERPSARRDTTTAYGLLGQTAGLRNAGVLGNKHIPIAYLRANTEVRLALLAGILDTDGFIQANGGVAQIDLTCKALADGVAELAATFGWKVRRKVKRATLYGKDCGPCYRVSFRPDRQVFRLPRKAARLGLRSAQQSRHTLRTIVSVERVPTAQTKCVQVNSPSSLYLAGRNFVPTHNSHNASVVAGWWLDSHPPGQAFVVTTAPTGAQVKAILWRYIRRVHKAGNLPGRVNQTEWLIDEELVGIGRKPSDHDEAAFQGIHAPHVLVILDEAGGIPEALWVAADALTTNVGCRMLAIGNPDNPASHFKTVCDPGSGWHTIKISAFDSPNLTGEDVPRAVSQALVSKEWVEEKRVEWGEDNPLYIAKVLGEFAQDSDFQVVRSSDIAACRIDPERKYTAADLTPVVLGVDVGGGGDETVIRERRGIVAGREWKAHTDRPEKIAPLILMAIRETGATIVNIDSIGIGFGVIGELRNAAQRKEHKATINAVNVAEAALDAKKFANLRAQIWWEIGRVMSEKREWDLSKMDNADTTVAQLLAPQWEVDSKGRIKVEAKDEIRARLKRSPDNADALLLAYFAGIRVRIRTM